VLKGREVALRARVAADTAILHAALYEDVEMHSISDGRAWRPMSADAEVSPYRVVEPSSENAVFTIVTLSDERVIGDLALWRIDLHNRSAHVGLALVPEARGQGFGLDAVQVCVDYAFRTLGLHRLQIETTVENHGMISVARKAGFSPEGVLRDAGWVNGRFLDEAVFGLLAQEWQPRTTE
jgi:RimJ/RimL family protein N-acetyltransferase